MSDAAAGIASVPIAAEAECAEAERLVEAHRASVNDKDPLAPVYVHSRLATPVIVASGETAGDFVRRTVGSSGGDDFPDLPSQKKGEFGRTLFLNPGHRDGSQARRAGLRVRL